MEIRVRVSLFVNGLEAVKGKGSALKEIVSKATARVLAVWLIKVGRLLVAAVAVVRQANRRKGTVKPLTAQRRKLVLIKGSAPKRFPNDLLSQGEVMLSSGATVVRNQVKVNISFWLRT